MRSLLLAALLAVPAAAQRAKLVHVAGAVSIQPKSQGAMRAGKAGDALADGDTLAAASGAAAVLELPDGSRLKLRESSRMKLSLPGPKSKLTEITLVLGGLFAKVQRRPGAEFRVRAAAAVAAVRGTEFFTLIGKQTPAGHNVWLCVNEGQVEARSNEGSKTVLVPQGKGVLLRPAADPGEPAVLEWTKGLNWNMDPKAGALQDKTAPAPPVGSKPDNPFDY